MSTRRPAARTISVAQLLRVDPLSAAPEIQLAHADRRVDLVVLAETFERLQQIPPHAVVILHAEAAAGGWSLAAALHAAWERNASAVIAPLGITTPAGFALAKRLDLSLLAIDTDPVGVALQLAAQVSDPDVTLALQQARWAGQLAEQSSLAGVLAVLNAEQNISSVALAIGDRLVAGHAAALVPPAQAEQVVLELNVPGERVRARLIATITSRSEELRRRTETLLFLARPALLAAWAEARLSSSVDPGRDQAAFGLLRRLAAAPSRSREPVEPVEPVVPDWTAEFGWRLEGPTRAVWFAPALRQEQPPDELTNFLRAAWQRGHKNWPFVLESDGWVSWLSEADDHAVPDLRKALRDFRSMAETNDVAIGVGRSHSGLKGLMASVAEARLAAHVARARTEGVEWFDRVGPSAVLACLPIAEIGQVAALALPELAKARDRAVLVATVLAVLDCGGSLSQASSRLGVHRNTVLARATRARALGVAFDDPAERLAVHTLCYALVALEGSDLAASTAPGCG